MNFRTTLIVFIIATTLALSLLVIKLIAAESPDDIADGKRTALLLEQIETLRPLHKPMGKPQPGDWLTQHKERGQTFLDYVRSEPMRPIGKRNTIYIQPLGEFTKTQRKIIDLTAQFMSDYFMTPVQVSEDLPLKIIPASAMRVHPQWGDAQILSTHVLDQVLKPRLPEDAAAYIAFTASDLWPGEGWNFVFGQASLRDRVGVWSIYRNGNPDASEKDFALCLRRTLQTATHETGHMFSIPHCIAFECNMCGSNNRKESDRRPLWLCPQCVSKVNWAARSDAVTRYEKLKVFCGKNGMKDEEAFYEKSIAALKAGEKK